MARLTTKERNSLPDSDFALPGRRYPVENRSHAANALARVSQYGTAAEKAAVDKKVDSRYPDMGDPKNMTDHDADNKKKKQSKHSKHEQAIMDGLKSMY